MGLHNNQESHPALEKSGPSQIIWFLPADEFPHPLYQPEKKLHQKTIIDYF